VIPKMTPEIAGFGEAMVLFEAADLVHGGTASIHVAGAELNLCAAAVRLGASAAFCSRVGADPLGERVIAATRALGVRDLIEVDAGRQTGVFLKEVRPDGARRVHYYRKDSAASTMDSRDVARLLALEPAVVAVSGITACLGPGPRAAVKSLARKARLAFDPNLRPALGEMDGQIALAHSILPDVDFLLLGTDEAALIFETDTPEEVLKASPARETVLKAGADGCYYRFEGGIGHQPSLATTVVDPVGAGDAFAGGFLVARLRGAPVAAAAWLGSALAAGVVSAHGDTAGLPTVFEAEGLLRRALRVG
jgi:2-dehydro-3-deoxygluconokinase